MKDAFVDQRIFGTKAIAAFYRQHDPDVTQTAINRRINRLVQMEHIGRVQRGKYVLANKQQYFTPNLPEQFHQLYSLVKEAFPFIDTCLWSTEVYASLMRHVPATHYQIIEVDRDSCEAVFHWMVSEGYMAVLSPSQEFLNNYQHLLQKHTWVIQPLITESPLRKLDDVHTSSLEKLLVDMFSKDAILSFLQGAERSTVFKNAFEKHIINRSTLMRYARRRNLSSTVAEVLQEINDPISI